jgi:hypothetical protein
MKLLSQNIYRFKGSKSPLLFGLICLFILAQAVIPKAYGAPSLPAQMAMKNFLDTLSADLFTDLSRNMVHSNPQKSHQFLQILQEELGSKLFGETVLVIAQHEDFLKRFLDTSASSTDLAMFKVIMKELLREPEVIQAITLNSIKNQSNEDIVKIIKRASLHPESLKLFTSILDDKVVAEFSKKTFEDQKTLTFVIKGLQKDLDQIQNLGSGVDLKKVSTKILEKIDKSYFRNLLAPDNADPELLFRSLSLTDGMIDIQGQEQINLKGLDRSALKTMDPAFVIAFLWNIYFGDRSSKTALEFRKSLKKADQADGKNDGIVWLRPLAQKDPEIFQDLHKQLAEILDIARFQKKFTDPELLLEPIIEFLKNNEAHLVAQTLSPLFIRSLEIQPKLAKIVTLNLPPEVIGTLLGHVVDFLSSTAEGQAVLRKLMLTLWQSINTEDLKTFITTILDINPQSLYDMVVPVMLDLSPQALSQITQTFTHYPETFFRFNVTALAALNSQKMIPIVNAITQKPQEYYQIAQEVVQCHSNDQLNDYFFRLEKNPNMILTMNQIITSLDQKMVNDLDKRFKEHPKMNALIIAGFPPELVRHTLASFAKRVQP